MKFSLIATSLILTLFIVGCMVEPPGEPKWEVEVTIPIADRVYSLEELVTDPENIGETADYVTIMSDTLFMNFTDSIDQITMEDQLTRKPVDDLIQAYVGIRTVDEPGSAVDYYEILNQGSYPALPDSAFGPEQDYTTKFEDYDWAELHSGDFTLTVTNHMPSTIRWLNIKMYNTDPGSLLLLDWDIEQSLAQGESADTTAPLPQGERIYDRFRLVFTGFMEAVNEPVDIDAQNNHLETNISLGPMEVIRAKAHIDEQSFEEDSLYTIEEGDSVEIAQIREGTLTYTVTNQTNLVNIATFTMPDFTLNEEPFTVIHTLNPGESQSETMSLEGYQFHREIRDNLVHGILNVDVLDTDFPPYPNAGELVVVDSTHTVDTEFWISDLTFNKFVGYLNERIREIDQEPEYLDEMPEGLETLEADQANLDLRLQNIIGSPMWVDLQLDAYNDGSIEGTYYVQGLAIPAGSPETPAILDTILTGLEPIINAMPDYVIPSGLVRVYGEADLEEWQWVEGEYRIYSPFFLTITDTTTLEPELSNLDEGFEDILVQTEMNISLENHIPLEGEAFIIASFDSLQLIEYDPEGEVVDTFFNAPLPVPELDADGYVIDPGYEPASVLLDEAQLQMFSDASEDRPLFIKTYITVNPTENLVVRCRPTDYVKVGATAHVVLMLGDTEGDSGGGQ